MGHSCGAAHAMVCAVGSGPSGGGCILCTPTLPEEAAEARATSPAHAHIGHTTLSCTHCCQGDFDQPKSDCNMPLEACVRQRSQQRVLKKEPSARCVPLQSHLCHTRPRTHTTHALTGRTTTTATHKHQRYERGYTRAMGVRRGSAS
jgi:hypothetical protein